MSEIPGMLDQVARVSVAQKLFDARSIVICGEIDADLARAVVEQLLAMAAVSNDDVTLYLHSPGGHVEAADTIFDLLGFIRPRVTIVGTGWVASAGAHIYLAVPREQRYCLPNTRFLLHEPRGGIGGMASDVEIQAREVLRMRERLNRIFADATGQPLDKIKRDTDRDYWMQAEEAKAYGLVGKIVKSASEVR